MFDLYPYWRKWRRSSRNLSRWILMPAICFLELLFHFWIGASFRFASVLELVGFAVCVGGILNVAAALIPRKYVRWFTGILLFLAAAIMMTEFMIGEAYYNYMRPALVLVSAGGVITDYTETMVDMIFDNMWRICIALIPLFLLLISGRRKVPFNQRRCIAVSLSSSLIGLWLGFAGLSVISGGLETVVPDYDFSSSMKRYGITVSMYMELSGLANQGGGLSVEIPEFEIVPPAETEPTTVPETTAETEPETTAPAIIAETAPAATEPATSATEATVPETTVPAETTMPASEPAILETAPETTAAAEPETVPVTMPETIPVTEPKTMSVAEPETIAETEPETVAETEPETIPETEPEKEEPHEPQPHVIEGLDLAALAETDTDPVRKKVLEYMASLTPAMENEYTGLLAGKNLILITAEAFNYAIIDPELTPTLYRLSTQGINFTNYYEPLWTGNTSGGEMVNISGLAMNCEMLTYSNQLPFNTMGRQLMNQGYYSRAYHNNGGYYYDRDKTHENLGYEKFIAMGNGMEEGVKNTWPQSDWEMFDFTIPDAIENQPFSLYYMTVSAHCRYSAGGNAISRKNMEEVAHLPYSSGLKAYFAANLELEKGLASMVAQLEEAGIADDTVIVLAPDHFPYGLGTAWGNDHDCLGELYGMTKYDVFQRDKNTLIIWSGCLEGMGLQVDSPVCSVDILPTLSNLFGLEYDSRMSVGRDALGTEEAISFWPDYNWITDLGKYESSLQKFTPFTDDIPEGYVERISAIVRNRISVSRSIQNCAFFRRIQEALDAR